ncbi:MAG: glycosyltransferase family 61 protein [Planctomycetota bacterium]|nr:MAG: glycosyltransferase family 61 protein [Planctomycetota bacterium]REJ89314.1 MAG: glycosyltransferase family 61 protein [Planctomycetota bacterium]REK22889.1 MAG: glycosyltransferase family 61 protein [Planctomycetota bacterium]REK37411.1 MAG: glycosyltransferase family 61 protein [Planctomycetota bacterium]
MKPYRPPRKLYRHRKYLFTAESLLPPLSGVRGPRAFLPADELAARHPEFVTRHEVGTPETLPRYDYHYQGGDAFYTGHLDETPVAADHYFAIREGRVYGRHGTVIGPDDLALQEFDYGARKLAELEDVLTGYRWRPRYWKHRLRRAAFQLRMPAPQRLSGRLFVINGGASHNYYHWTIETLPKLHTLQASGLEADWYLADTLMSFQRQTLEAFGVPLDRVIQPYSSLHLQADELLAAPRLLAESCRAMGRKILAHAGDQATPPSPRVYVSRRGTRRVRNEAQLAALLKRFEFDEHFLEDYTVAQQAQLFHQAEVIVAPHGAGLANLVFARPGAQVVELMTEGRRALYFPELSRLMGLEHWLLESSRIGLRQDMVAPVDQLERVLEELCRKPRRGAAA